MIIDLPTSDEFVATGKAFLNLAWEEIIRLSTELDRYKEYDNYNDEEEQLRLEEKYWKNSQHNLLISIALAQQGTEFMLKGKIAAISPYLLISDEPGKWISGCDTEDKSFADFKTVDAQDLIRLHDTICSPRLPDSFKTTFKRLRRLRNTTMHSLDKRATVSVKDVAITIMQISEVFTGPQSWHCTRKMYFEERDNLFGAYDINPGALFAQETLHVVDKLGLTPAELKKHYGFDPRLRRYFCPECYDSNYYYKADLAQLSPNTPDSKALRCLSCQTTFKVLRRKCKSRKQCPGNVLADSTYDHRCLTCFE
ncbi:MAG: hypothetical protein EKK48_28445 [Candidatus Melainabacteria bacterium]|nr:MAG: hypothetical protein EKK48_28445 [Candidatus Melainabacteria bacterium]